MILATSNPIRQVLWIGYVGHIVPADLAANREELKQLLAGLKPGFRLLVNFSHMDAMGVDCREELGRTMELISLAGVGRVVRIIPDPKKDIGFNILGFFHYHNHPQMINPKNGSCLKNGTENHPSRSVASIWK